MTGFLTLLPVYTYIHQYRHTHSDITVDTLPPPRLPYQTHPTNLGTTDNIMEHSDML